MFCLSLLVFVAIFIEGAVSKLRPSIFASDGRIVGGQNAKIEDYPYMAALEENGLLCGATIITNRHVVTAAHCLENYPSVRELLIRVGTSIRNTGGQITQVRKYALHPKYTKDSADYDVAVVELKSLLVFGSTVQAVPLQKVNQEPAIGSFANATGWGYTSADDFSLILQVIVIPRMGQKYCEEIWGVTPRMICYGFDEGGKGACGGDSGGPLVSNGKLVGVVSFGGKCAAPKQPGGYTNIANKEIHDFINTCIKYILI